MDAKRLAAIKHAAEQCVADNDDLLEALDHIDQQQVEIERLTLENWQLKGALGYPVPGNIIEGPWIKGIAEAMNNKLVEQEAEIERLSNQSTFNRELFEAQCEVSEFWQTKFERLKGANEMLWRHLKHFAQHDGVAVLALEEAQRIKEGKDGGKG